MNSTAAQRQALEAKRGSPDRHGNRDSLMPTLLLLYCSAPNQRASDTRRATYDKNATRNEGLVARRAAHADANSFAPCRPPCLTLAARAHARTLPVRACVHRAGIIKSAALISASRRFTLRATARGAWTARVAQPAVPSRAGYCVNMGREPCAPISNRHDATRSCPCCTQFCARSALGCGSLARLFRESPKRQPTISSGRRHRSVPRAVRRAVQRWRVQRIRRGACTRPPIRIDRLKRRRPTRLEAPVQMWRGASPVPAQMAQG
jgi:hypothetical protein